MFHDCCQSVTLVFCQRTHVSHDHHPRGPCCSRASISYDEPYMGRYLTKKFCFSTYSHVISAGWHLDYHIIQVKIADVIKQSCGCNQVATYRVRWGQLTNSLGIGRRFSSVFLADASRRHLHDSWVDNGPLQRGPAWTAAFMDSIRLRPSRSIGNRSTRSPVSYASPCAVCAIAHVVRSSSDSADINGHHVPKSYGR